MKAQKLIALSFRDIGKLGSEQDITSAMYQDAIDSLNFIMYEKAYLGLGYTEIRTSSDDLTTPNWSWRWMRYKLAIELSHEYGQLDGYLALDRAENDAYSTVLAAANVIPTPTLNGNVPLGSGNLPLGDCGPDYYPESDDAVLSEQNQIIVTEGS